jgi:hypothetical protein
VGFELEFLLLKPAPQELLSGPGAAAAAAGSAHVLRGADGRAWVPWDDTVYCQASSIDSAMAGERTGRWWVGVQWGWRCMLARGPPSPTSCTVCDLQALPLLLLLLLLLLLPAPLLPQC